MAQVAIACDLPVSKTHAPGGIMNQIIDAGERDDDLYLDIIDATLFHGGFGDGSIASALDASGSIWRVASDRKSLERRVDEVTSTAALAAMNPSDEASAELLAAWKNVYRLSPDPSDAWDHAIKAVEAVLIPLLLPSKPKATLGQVLQEIERNPGARSFLLGTSSHKVDALGTLVAMLRLIWPNPDRHGGSGADRQPSLEEAEAVVNLAVTVVHWTRLGVVT